MTNSRHDQRALSGLASVIDLENPEQRDLVGLPYDIHELALEDAYEAHQRPKLERFEAVVSLVLKTVRYDDDAEWINFGELHLLWGDDFLVTVRHGDASRLAATVDLLGGDLDLTPAEAVHRIVDFCTDEYEPVMDSVDVDVYEIERDVFSPERTNPAERVYRLKRQVLELRRNVTPLLAALERLVSDPSIGLDEELLRYYGDVEDHLRRLAGRIEQADALLTDVLSANLAQISVQQNADMRRMSAWALIFLVPTLLAGIWGMNFENMPSLSWKWGYPLSLAIMAALSAGLYWYLRRAKWL